MPVSFAHRLATPDDASDLTWLVHLAIEELQKPFLSEAEIASSRLIMGLDRQLISDGTYFVVKAGERLAGCGGCWLMSYSPAQGSVETRSRPW